MAKENPIDEWLEADGLILLESWARDGYTVDDIATRIGIHSSTLRKWMANEPEIKKAINTGRELVDYKVENALLKSALGYKTREVKVSAKIKNGRVIEETKETIDKEFAPNVSACQVWLYNRAPKKWKNMNSKANILDEIDEDTSIHITVERASVNEGLQGHSMATIDEVDVDWQNDVNTGITLRKATEEEKAEKEKKLEKKKSRNDDGRQYSSKDARNDAQHDDSTVDTKIDEDDLDYWPDDWEDDDEWED